MVALGRQVYGRPRGVQNGIVETILSGRQPINLTARRLERIGTLPREWDSQRRLLGFPA
jgi:hypothetical protein